MVLDLSTMKFKDGDFKRSDEYSYIIESSESIILDDSWICFSVDGLDDGLFINFTQEFEGYWTHCSGDYWTPPDSNFNITKDEVFINNVTIDDIEVEMTPELDNIFVKLLIAEIDKY